MYYQIEFWRSLPSLSLAITTFYWVWICFMAHLLSLLLIPKSFLNFWLFFYWLGGNFFCSQKSLMETALSTGDVDYQKYTKISRKSVKYSSEIYAQNFYVVCAEKYFSTTDRRKEVTFLYIWSIHCILSQNQHDMIFWNCEISEHFSALIHLKTY